MKEQTGAIRRIDHPGLPATVQDDGIPGERRYDALVAERRIKTLKIAGSPVRAELAPVEYRLMSPVKAEPTTQGV